MLVKCFINPVVKRAFQYSYSGIFISKSNATRMNFISHRMAHVSVSPAECLHDEPVTIQVTGLEHNMPYTLCNKITDGNGVGFHSLAHYKSDDSGTIDLNKQPADGGHFAGLFPMGLFNNFAPVKTDKKHPRFSFRGLIDKPLTYDLSVYSGLFAPHICMGMSETLGLEPLCHIQHLRRLVGPGCKREEVRFGKVRGALHLPPGPGPHPAVIDMYGSSGGLMEHRAAMFASRGFVSLALAFFGYEDLPPDMSDGFDMAYFDEAVQFLLGRDEVSKGGVGAVGVSKGGDLVLSMVIDIPEVVAAVLINSSNAVIGCPTKFKDGTSIQSLNYDISRLLLVGDGVVDIKHLMNDPVTEPDSMLPLERIPRDTNLLWIVGLDDRNYDSEYYADMAVARGGAVQNKVLKFPKAGHLIDVPYTPFCYASYHKLAQSTIIWGGEPQHNCKAQEQTWQAMLKFFRKKLLQKNSKL